MPNAAETTAPLCFVNSRQLKQRYGGVSDMWVFRRLRDDSGFPQPMLIRGRRFWRLSDLAKWERTRARPEASAAA
jgi:hypothetical protein